MDFQNTPTEPQLARLPDAQLIIRLPRAKRSRQKAQNEQPAQVIQFADLKRTHVARQADDVFTGYVSYDHDTITPGDVVLCTTVDNGFALAIVRSIEQPELPGHTHAFMIDPVNTSLENIKYVRARILQVAQTAQ